MTSLTDLEKSWKSKGMLDIENHFLPTFLEEVGTACAENVRSAALMRWARRNGPAACGWLKSMLGHDIEGIFPRREVQLVDHKGRSCGRIDLELKPAEAMYKRILAEVKWCASPSRMQMDQYNEAIDVLSNSEILLLTPIEIKQVVLDKNCPVAEWKRYPDNIVFTTWTELQFHIEHTSNPEDGFLSLTVERWANLVSLVEALIQRVSLPELIDLIAWMSAIQAPVDYITLVKQLVLAKLADSLCEMFGPDWFRSYPSKGAHGADITVDVFNQRTSFFPCKLVELGKVGGILVSIRLRIHTGKKMPVIEIQLGSAWSPYETESQGSELEYLRKAIKTCCNQLKISCYDPRTDNPKWQRQVSESISDWNHFMVFARRLNEIITDTKGIANV
jgi:hypothetical protein